MKHHKYYNTIWSDRDGEFYWDGLKDGTLVGSIVALCGVLLISEVVDLYKNHKKEHKQ